MRRIGANYVFSPESGFIKNGILELDAEGRILNVNKVGLQQEEPRTEFYNGILCPGFVNAHCHLELSHMRGAIREGIGLHNFIHDVVTGRQFEKEEILNAIEEADKEMQREGIIAVGDISNREDSYEVKSSGNIFYHTFVEVFNLSTHEAEETLNRGLDLLEKAKSNYQLSASLVPHASYSVSEALFRLFRKKVNQEDNLLSIHNLETEYENECIQERKGILFELFKKLGMESGDSVPAKMRSMPWLIKMIPKKPPLLLVHNVHITAKDIEQSGIDRDKTWYCLCPASNLYIANVLPGDLLIKAYPDKVCIGTDSLASNHSLSILHELQILEENYPDTGLEKLLRFATLNGAKMLGIDHWAGSFENGKQPGVNLLENVDLDKMALGSAAVVRKLI